MVTHCRSLLHKLVPVVCRASVVVVLLLGSRLSVAEPVERTAVLFETTVETVFGQSVYVLGDLPELGADDITRAVKLEPSGYPTWRITISLPAGTPYTYRYMIRDDGPGQGGNPANGAPVGGVSNDATAPDPAGCVIDHRTMLYHSAWEDVTLHWRLGSPLYTSTPMRSIGSGRSPDESRWGAWAFASSAGELRFFLTNADGDRDPPTGEYATPLAAALLQDGRLYDYLPAPVVSASRKDYSPAAPPAIVSGFLGQSRRYRVLLPRGYDEHSARRYPVVYFHDGQNVFEQGPFGTWSADQTIDALVDSGQMREVIAVGVDNVGSTRLDDYRPPGDGGRADDYADFLRAELKPVIDAQYRTLTGPDHTAVLGSSMGGLVSLYLGWDFSGVFGRVGAMSGSWQFGSLLARIAIEPKRDLMLYLDSGDCCAGSSDNYGLTYALRDTLAGGVIARYSLEGTIRHAVGYGQQHTESAWASRLPMALGFLAPTSVSSNELLTGVFGAHWDVNADGRFTIDDLIAQTELPSDLNLDGVRDAVDTGLLESALRRDQAQSSVGAAR